MDFQPVLNESRQLARYQRFNACISTQPSPSNCPPTLARSDGHRPSRTAPIAQGITSEADRALASPPSHRYSFLTNSAARK